MVAAFIVLSALLIVSVVWNIILCVGSHELNDFYNQMARVEECMSKNVEKKLED